MWLTIATPSPPPPQGFHSNKLCDDVPTQVQALSSSVITGWQVTTGNSFGTICGWQSYMADARFPTIDGSTGITNIDYNQKELSGTIPTEVSGRVRAYVQVSVNDGRCFREFNPSPHNLAIRAPHHPAVVLLVRAIHRSDEPPALLERSIRLDPKRALQHHQGDCAGDLEQQL